MILEQVLRNNPLLAGTAEETPEKPNQEPEAALVQLMEQLRVEPVVSFGSAYQL